MEAKEEGLIGGAESNITMLILRVKNLSATEVKFPIIFSKGELIFTNN